MAVNPFGPQNAANEMPFKAGAVPKVQLPNSLMRLARMRAYGFGAGSNVQPISQPMALTVGSHGRTG